MFGKTTFEKAVKMGISGRQKYSGRTRIKHSFNHGKFRFFLCFINEDKIILVPVNLCVYMNYSITLTGKQ